MFKQVWHCSRFVVGWALLRGLARTDGAKIRHLFGLCKDFEEKMCKVSAKKQVYMFFCRAAAIFIQKVWKWRRFLTAVVCWDVQNAGVYKPTVQGTGQCPAEKPRLARNLTDELIIDCWLLFMLIGAHQAKASSWLLIVLVLASSQLWGLIATRRQMLTHFPTVTQSTGFQPEPLLTPHCFPPETLWNFLKLSETIWNQRQRLKS